MTGPAQWLAEAQNHHQAQRFQEAEALYRRVVAAEPGNAAAWYHLGIACAAQNKLGDAGATFERILSDDPSHVDALVQMGIVLARQRHVAEAISKFRQAIEFRPEHAKAHNNLGVALAELGRHEEAVAAFQEALRCQPDYAEAHFNLAVRLAERRQVGESMASYERALLLRPDYPEACCNLGLLLTQNRRPAEAIVHLQQALRLRPDYPDAHNNLGLAYADVGRFDEALASNERALTARPVEPELHMNRGIALALAGRFEEALAAYELSIRLRPEHAKAHWNRSLTLLTLGDFERGWPEYEWRWQRPESKMRVLPQPCWDGSALEGKTILLWCEQGIGDTLQFIRYANLLKEMGATVWLECPVAMMALLSTCPGIARCYPEGKPAPKSDWHAPLMSLPFLCKTALSKIPAAVPYLGADARRVKHWRTKIGQAPGLKIGVSWQGNPKHRYDRHRSFAVHWFQGLASVAGVELFSLQKQHGTEQLATARFGITDLGGEFQDRKGAFHDAAAAMQALDLVITCDSAVAHLAGALGVPVWVALSTFTDWRWLRDRDDSPWYPSMRLFRQEKLGDWRAVFERMRDALASGRTSPVAARATAVNLVATAPLAGGAGVGNGARVEGGPYEVAVVIPTILRPSLKQAVQSVFDQRIKGPGQLLVGVDCPVGDRGVLAEIQSMKPAHWTVSIFDPGYSTSVRHGGMHPAADGGALRTILSYAANSRHVAYLDDDNWWAPEHLATLLAAIAGHDWAFSRRWFVDGDSSAILCEDTWESVGPGQGVFRAKFNGFVDPSTLMLDKQTCEPVLRLWAIPLKGEKSGLTADRNVFHALETRYRGVGSGQATSFYRMSVSDGMHAQRLAKIKQVTNRGSKNDKVTR